MNLKGSSLCHRWLSEGEKPPGNLNWQFKPHKSGIPDASRCIGPRFCFHSHSFAGRKCHYAIAYPRSIIARCQWSTSRTCSRGLRVWSSLVMSTGLSHESKGTIVKFNIVGFWFTKMNAKGQNSQSHSRYMSVFGSQRFFRQGFESPTTIFQGPTDLEPAPGGTGGTNPVLCLSQRRAHQIIWLVGSTDGYALVMTNSLL